VGTLATTNAQDRRLVVIYRRNVGFHGDGAWDAVKVGDDWTETSSRKTKSFL